MNVCFVGADIQFKMYIAHGQSMLNKYLKNVFIIKNDIFLKYLIQRWFINYSTKKLIYSVLIYYVDLCLK